MFDDEREEHKFSGCGETPFQALLEAISSLGSHKFSWEPQVLLGATSSLGSHKLSWEPQALLEANKFSFKHKFTGCGKNHFAFGWRSASALR
jgi:hypothetical protein